MRFKPPKKIVEHRCRWCGQKLGDWHYKKCSPGQAGDGRVHDRDCMRVEYKLWTEDVRRHLMHKQLLAAWDRGEGTSTAPEMT